MLHKRRLFEVLKPWLDFTPSWLVLQFLEYSRNISWNIPYSKIMNIQLVFLLFWNIPEIFHIPKIALFILLQCFLEYEYSYRKTQITMENPNIPAIFHIPNISILCLFTFFLEYSISDIFIFHGLFPMEYSTSKKELVLRGRKV